MAYIAGADLDGLQATLGTLRFNAVDSAGVAWRLKAEDGLQGWDSPEVRAEVTQREADHGAWAAPVYLSERAISLAGTIEAGNRAALDDAMERLRAAVALTDTTLTVWESVPKQATVRRSGKLLAQYLTDRVGAFSALVTAPDPRRYGITLQSGTANLPSSSGGLSVPATMPLTIAATVNAGSFTAANTGTFGTRPVFTIAGPVSNPRIVVDDGSGAEPVTLTYGQVLATGETLVIDCDAHTVVLNGTASRRRYLTATVWPEFPAGSSVTVQFRASAYNASAQLSAQWRSAWL